MKQARLGVLRAEWTKLRTAPGTIWLPAATMVLTVAVSTAVTAATRCPAGAARPVDPAKHRDDPHHAAAEPVGGTGGVLAAWAAAALLDAGLPLRLRDA
jgi:hypothetical protein